MSSKAPEFGPNDWFVQERYEEFLADPESVDPIWREYFGTKGVGVADSTSSTVNGDTEGTSTGTSAIGASRPLGRGRAATSDSCSIERQVRHDHHRQARSGAAPRDGPIGVWSGRARTGILAARFYGAITASDIAPLIRIRLQEIRTRE